MTATIRAHLMPLVWESDFFALPSARLSFRDDAPVLTSAALTAYAVVQAKVAASDLATIDALSAGGFQLAESEVDFCLPIDSVEPVLPAWRVADTADIALLRDAASCVFSQSRFRTPWYHAADSGRFYAQWVENAVRGTFDDVCLIAHDEQGAPLGWVTLRQTQTDQARIGLLAAWPGTSGGVGMRLMALVPTGSNYLTMAFLLCVLVGMYINEDTRMSLLVGMAFLAVVSVIYAMLEGRKKQALTAPEA